MKPLTVSLIQPNVYWENITANLHAIEEKIWEIETSTDIIVLPEMFNSGYTMAAEKVAEPMNLHTFKWLRQMASQHQAVVTGSYVVKEGTKYFNRLVWMYPDGDFATYDKRHLFRMAEEHEIYDGGGTRLVVEYKGWKICPLICYDLRFPVWSRQLPNAPYDVLLYVANWPQARASAWDALLPARAIENLCYAVGVNRIGEDGKGIPFGGGSQACDYLGNRLLKFDEEEAVGSVTFDGDKLLRYREKFPAHLDADRFYIE